MRNIYSGILFLLLLEISPAILAQDIIHDPSAPVENRVDALVSKMTLEEKTLQMQNAAPAIPRLGIPAYDWWNECLHGVGRNGIATVFPQAIGMAATWNPGLIGREAGVISTEARAKYRMALDSGQHGTYQGLTFYSPNINIFRDPRWGRGQETYGEDPFLTARIGVAFVKGLQGNDPAHPKVIATAKHYAVHSGPESSRHSFDAWCSDRDLFETYLPAFEALVREGHVGSVMGAYNRFRSEPCCSDAYLLGDILRKKWGFTGYVTTDCGALWDIWHGHKLQPDEVRPAAMGLRAGCDLACGTDFAALPEAVQKGYVTREEVDMAVKRLFTARFRLGMFDPDGGRWSEIPANDFATVENRSLAAEVARESIVLLKNAGQVLPLSKDVKSIAVIGPYADRVYVLLGNYNGIPENPVTILRGIREKMEATATIRYAMGTMAPEDVLAKERKKVPGKWKLRREAVEAARMSDVVIFSGGISPLLEGEELQVKVPGFSGGDRTTLDLPADQRRLLKKLHETGKPVILVLTNGSALSVNWEAENLPAIVEAWYPGEQGGAAIADVLFGDYNPAGRLPVTFYQSVNDLPPFDDYSMKGRTYRYFTGKPLYPFGHGLSYTTFDYLTSITDKPEYDPADTLALRVRIRNTGNVAGDEVVQVYASRMGASDDEPQRKLVGFSRVHFSAGEEKEVTIRIPVRELRVYDPGYGDYRILPDAYQLQIGSSSGDIRHIHSIKIR